LTEEDSERITVTDFGNLGKSIISLKLKASRKRKGRGRVI